jgi:chitinase
MGIKTTYALDQGLNGIMFWEITNDTNRNGLLHTINETKKSYKRSP